MDGDWPVSGSVYSIIYKNGENGYTVFSVDTGDDEITCTGILPDLNEGEYVRLSGSFVKHPIYGEQFNVAAYEKTVPESTEGMEPTVYIISLLLLAISG